MARKAVRKVAARKTARRKTAKTVTAKPVSNSWAVPASRERMLSPREVADILAVDPKTVSRWADEGKLSAVWTLGGHRRFRESEVMAAAATMGA